MFPICLKCHHVVDTFETTMKIENINGIEVLQIHGYCKDCNSELWIDYFDDLNVELYCKKVKELRKE